MLTGMQVIREILKDARENFEGTVKDVTADMLHTNPGGKAFPIGATWAHVVFSEDAIVQKMMQGKTPLFESSFQDKTGASSPIPPMDDKWNEANETWGHSVKIDLPKFREYAKAVFAATDEYVAGLTDEDLEKEIDMGWGKKTVWFLLCEYITAHLCSITGEISALKGLQGAKGYPF